MKNETLIKARYAETDQMGIIHHSVYPVWFEEGRTNFIKDLGVTYSQIEKKGVMIPLVSIECRYILPVRYEDEVIIETVISKLKYAKAEFSYRVIMKNDGRIMAEGSTVHAFVNSDTFRPINIKKTDPDIYKRLYDACNE